MNRQSGGEAIIFVGTFLILTFGIVAVLLATGRQHWLIYLGMLCGLLGFASSFYNYRHRE